MPFDPLDPNYQRQLIIPCKHEGLSFYSFVDVDYTNKQFVVVKISPEIEQGFNQIIPFTLITDTHLAHKPLTDDLCETIVTELVEYFK